MKEICILVFVFLAIMAVSFGVFAGLVKLLSLCFHFQFSWTLTSGLFILWLIAKSIFSRGK